ncbi:succinate dehydrogenase/fumarate reductase cytochrome b subunit [Ferrimonas pelagia]|uniref:Fumarate reductase cytochrome b subunit n=1 Tax=Ferrimonas pelagia TaxID=1177826 RepID=A0ABP9ENS1_9GAMM
MRKLLELGRGPARMDLLQGATGLALMLFLLVHLHMEASVLLGTDAFDAVAWFLHAGWADPTGVGYGFMVVLAVLVVSVLLIGHVLAVLRRLPTEWRQVQALRQHIDVVKHDGTRLWLTQVGSGVALMILLPIHLATMMTQPHSLGAEPSSLRIVFEGGWFLYGLLLPAAVIHGMAGVVRLWLKWCPYAEPRFDGRRWGRRFAIYLLVLGSLSLLMQVYNGLFLFGAAA